MVIIPITLLLEAFLWLTAFFHGSHILSSLFWNPQLNGEHQPPEGWVDYLNPLSWTQTYQAYLLAYFIYVVWVTAMQVWLGPDSDTKPPFLLQTVGPGTSSLLLWAVLSGIAHYYRAKGLIQAMPTFLDETLAICAALWGLQHLLVALLRGKVLAPTAAPAPAKEQVWSGVSDIMIDKPAPAPEPQTPETPYHLLAPVGTGYPSQPQPILPQPPPSLNSFAPPAVIPAAPTLSKGKAPGRPPKETTFALELQIMSVLELKGEIKTSELVKGLGMNRKAVNRLQEKLLREGRIIRVGRGRNAACRPATPPKAAPAKTPKKQQSPWKLFELLNKKPWGPQKNDPLVIAQCLEDILSDDMFADYRYPPKLRGDIKEMNYRDTVIWIRLTYKQTFRRIFENLLPRLVTRPSDVDLTIIHRRAFPFLSRYLAKRGFSRADIDFLEKASNELVYHFNSTGGWDE